MELSLKDFKFIQGLQAARVFLVQLRNTKEQSELRLNHKNPSSNSLQFSPIARRQSELCEQSSSEASRKHKHSPSMEQYQPAASEFLRNASKEQSANQPHISQIELHKNSINRIILQLSTAYSQLKITEAALEVLRQRLESKKDAYREIERLKNEEREKHFKILSLKNAIIRKRERLTQKRSTREKFRTIVASYVKDYLRTSDIHEEVIPILAPNLVVLESSFLEPKE